MSGYEVTVWTAPPAMPGVAPDVEAENQFLRDHPNLVLDPQGDGSVKARVQIEAESSDEAEKMARQLVADAMTTAGRTFAPEEITSEISP